MSNYLVETWGDYAFRCFANNENVCVQVRQNHPEFVDFSIMCNVLKILGGCDQSACLHGASSSRSWL